MGIRALTSSVGSRHSDGSASWAYVPGKPRRCETHQDWELDVPQIRSTLLLYQRKKCPLKTALLSLRCSLVS